MLFGGSGQNKYNISYDMLNTQHLAEIMTLITFTKMGRGKLHNLFKHTCISIQFERTFISRC